MNSSKHPLLLLLSVAACVGDAPTSDTPSATGGTAGVAGSGQAGGGAAASAGSKAGGSAGAIAGSAGQASSGASGSAGAAGTVVGKGGSAGSPAGTGGAVGAGKAGTGGGAGSLAGSAGEAGAGVGGSGGTSGTAGSSGAPICTGTCGDAGCAAYTCIAEPPVGWTGPFALYDGPEGGAPACIAPNGNEVLSVHADVDLEPAKCSACTCGAPTQPSCTAYVRTGDTAQCGSTVGPFAQSGTSVSTCRDVTGFGGNTGHLQIEPGYLSYACPPSTQAATRPSPKWKRFLRGCAPPFPQAKGCTAAAQCALIPTAPFETRLCVSSPGDVACPATTFTKRRLGYQGVDDTRDCTDCSCATSQTGCSYPVKLYASKGCTGNVINATVGGSLQCISANFMSVDQPTNVSYPSSLPCTPEGGAPKGTEDPKDPTTICCTP